MVESGPLIEIYSHNLSLDFCVVTSGSGQERKISEDLNCHHSCLYKGVTGDFLLIVDPVILKKRNRRMVEEPGDVEDDFGAYS